MKPITLCQAFDREDVGAVVTDRQRKARIDASSVDDDGACAALPPVAALFRSGQVQSFAKQVQERYARIIELDRPLHAIHGQSR
jgi:hypothetical protein